MTSLPSAPASTICAQCGSPADSNRHQYADGHAFVAPAPAHIDLSNLDEISDTELTALLGIAQARFAVVRANDPRRVSEAYSEAKYALDVIGRKHRARLAAVLVAQQQVASAARVLPTPRRGDIDAARARTSARGLASVFAATPDDSAF